MPVKRTTIELDVDLVHAAQLFTGDTLRATVERALHQMLASAEEQTSARRRAIADHLSRAGTEVDTETLRFDQAWR